MILYHTFVVQVRKADTQVCQWLYYNTEWTKRPCFDFESYVQLQERKVKPYYCI